MVQCIEMPFTHKNGVTGHRTIRSVSILANTLKFHFSQNDLIEFWYMRLYQRRNSVSKQAILCISVCVCVVHIHMYVSESTHVAVCTCTVRCLCLWRPEANVVFSDHVSPFRLSCWNPELSLVSSAC